MTVEKVNMSKYSIDGKPPLSEAVPLGFQHVIAMFVGNIVPMLLVAHAANLTPEQGNMLLQCCMLGAALSTLLQLYPIRLGSRVQIGAGLPCMLGLTYVFLPACLSLAGKGRIPAIFGAQIVAGFASVFLGLGLKKMRRFFPPVVTGTIVMTVGISIFDLAIGNLAGGKTHPSFGNLTNWAVGSSVVAIVLGLSMYGKGLAKSAAILIGMATGYIVSIPLGMVNFSRIANAGWFALPQPLAFGVSFDMDVILTFLILYFVVAVQMIGDFSVSSMGGMNRMPTDQELSGGIIGNGISSALSAIINSFPTATYSQNSGIVALTKVSSRFVIAVGCTILLVAGFCPKVGALFATIPNAVIGGGTLVVFSMIATSGMRLIAEGGIDNRTSLIVGVSLAYGIGSQFCIGAVNQFPIEIAAMLSKNSVILTTLLAIFLNMVFPQEKKENGTN